MSKQTMLVDLGFCVGKLTTNDVFPKLELHIIEPSCSDENVFTPSQSINIFGEGVTKLKNFLNEHIKGEN